MITQELKEIAFNLRRSGESYNDIFLKTGISKGTLSLWFKSMDWSIEIEVKNREINRKKSKERIVELNNKRKAQSICNREEVETEAAVDFQKYKTNQLFIAGIMLYLGEGDKSIKNGHLRMGNIDQSVLAIFIEFLVQFCRTDRDKIKFWLLCYPDHNVEICEKWWSESLGITKKSFYKTQVIQGKHKTKRLPYGVGNITITNVLLKAKVLKWIDLAADFLIHSASVV